MNVCFNCFCTFSGYSPSCLAVSMNGSSRARWWLCLMLAPPSGHHGLPSAVNFPGNCSYQHGSGVDITLYTDVDRASSDNQLSAGPSSCCPQSCAEPPRPRPVCRLAVPGVYCLWMKYSKHISRTAHSATLPRPGTDWWWVVMAWCIMCLPAAA